MLNALQVNLLISYYADQLYIDEQNPDIKQRVGLIINLFNREFNDFQPSEQFEYMPFLKLMQQDLYIQNRLSEDIWDVFDSIFCRKKEDLIKELQCKKPEPQQKILHLNTLSKKQLEFVVLYTGAKFMNKVACRVDLYRNILSDVQELFATEHRVFQRLGTRWIGQAAKECRVHFSDKSQGQYLDGLQKACKLRPEQMLKIEEFIHAYELEISKKVENIRGTSVDQALREVAENSEEPSKRKNSSEDGGPEKKFKY